MVADEQTHTLPSSARRWSASRASSALRTATPSRKRCSAHLRKVQRHYARLFEDAPAHEAARRALALSARTPTTRETLDRLAAMGFRSRSRSSAPVRRWLAGDYRSLKSEFARAQLAELVPVLIDQSGARRKIPTRARDRVRPLPRRAARRRAAVLAAAAAIRISSRCVALTLGTAPRLADILALHPQAMDALIEPAFFGALPDEAKLAAELARSLDAGALLRGLARPRRACSARSTCS